MPNLDVVQTKPDDFDRVYPLLQEFNNPRLTKDDWKRIFYPAWDIGDDYYCGYMLVNGDRVEGFLGYIFSRMLINGAETNFCNLTSWIVREEYRGQSLELFYPAMKLDNYVITDFSPTDAVLKMFHKRYRFAILETETVFIYPQPGFSRADRSFSFETTIQREMLDEKDARIYKDHAALNLHHILLRNRNGVCYVVAKNRRYRKFRHMELLYISNPGIFSECLQPFMRKLSSRFLVFGAIVDRRLLGGHTVPFSRSITPLKTTIFKSGIEIDPSDVTQLYTEKVLLA